MNGSTHIQPLKHLTWFLAISCFSRELSDTQSEGCENIQFITFTWTWKYVPFNTVGLSSTKAFMGLKCHFKCRSSFFPCLCMIWLCCCSWNQHIAPYRALCVYVTLSISCISLTSLITEEWSVPVQSPWKERAGASEGKESHTSMSYHFKANFLCLTHK